MESSCVVVSACLLGQRCRYDGGHCLSPGLAGDLKGLRIVPLCPEELGGLSTPRPAAEFERGADAAGVLAARARILTRDRRQDVSAAFCRGAREALRIARAHGAQRAILKEGSPSCGSQRIQRDGCKVPGEGVAAHLLRAAGIEIEAR